MPRRPTNAWFSPMEPESEPTERTMEDSKIPLQGVHQEMRTEISFCVVGYNHQNAVVERRIK